MTSNFLPKKLSPQKLERVKNFLPEMVRRLFPLPYGSHTFENKSIDLPVVVGVEPENGWVTAFSREGIVVITWDEILAILKSTGLPVDNTAILVKMTGEISEKMSSRREDPFKDVKTPWQRKMKLREMLEKYVGKTGVPE